MTGRGVASDPSQGERLARIEEQLKSLPKLEELLTNALTKLDARDNDLAQKIQARGEYCIGQTAVVSQIVAKVNDLDSRVKPLEELLPTLRELAKVGWQLKVIAAVGSALGVLFLGLIYSILTGQVRLVMP